MCETAIHKLTHETHPLLGNEEGKHSMSQERGEVLNPTARGTPREPGFNEMRPFGEAKSISGHQTLQLMRRPYGVKGSVYVVTLPAFQRCLEDGPDAAERRPGSGFPPGRGDRRRPSRGTSRPTGKTGETREGNPTRLGVRGSIVPADPRTEYSSFSKAGGRDLFSATEKNGADFTRHNLTMHPIPMICA